MYDFDSRKEAREFVIRTCATIFATGVFIGYIFGAIMSSYIR